MSLFKKGGEFTVSVPEGCVAAECTQNEKIDSFYVPIGYGAVAFGKEKHGINPRTIVLEAGGTYYTSKLFSHSETLAGVYGYSFGDFTFDLGFTDIVIGDKKYGYNGTVVFCLVNDQERNCPLLLLENIRGNKKKITVEDIRLQYFNFLVDLGRKTFQRIYDGTNADKVATAMTEALQQMDLLKNIGIQIKDFVINDNPIEYKAEEEIPEGPNEHRVTPEMCPVCKQPVPKDARSCPICGYQFFSDK